MTPLFRVGELAIIQNCGEPCLHLNGQECEVIGGLRVREGRDLVTGEDWTGFAYRVDCNGVKWIIEQNQLRKKRPPLASWGDILAEFNWHPKLTRTKA